MLTENWLIHCLGHNLRLGSRAELRPRCPIGKHLSRWQAISQRHFIGTMEPLRGFGLAPTDKEPDMDRNKEDNQGEGNRTAAREYNKAQQEFAKSGKVEQAARSAERALDTKEAKELKQAEELGRRHSHGEDPAVKR
jgi:hypothetical protein